MMTRFSMSASLPTPVAFVRTLHHQRPASCRTLFAILSHLAYNQKSIT